MNFPDLKRVIASIAGISFEIVTIVMILQQ